MPVSGTATYSVSHLDALKKKHAFLSESIDEARRLPSTTDYYLKQLKKQKLHLKEQIERIRDESDGED